jgi:hypothetical protein
MEMDPSSASCATGVSPGSITNVVASGDVFDPPSPGGSAAGLSRRERRLVVPSFKLTLYPQPLTSTRASDYTLPPGVSGNCRERASSSRACRSDGVRSFVARRRGAAEPTSRSVETMSTAGIEPNTNEGLEGAGR